MVNNATNIQKRDGKSMNVDHNMWRWKSKQWLGTSTTYGAVKLDDWFPNDNTDIKNRFPLQKTTNYHKMIIVDGYLWMYDMLDKDH